MRLDLLWPLETFSTMRFSRGMKLRRTSTSVDRAAERSRGQSILQNLLTELAAILLPRGVTPTRFNELAKHAFVHAAAGMSQFRNGKVNQSRVAVLTGLRRAEVRKLLNCATPVIPVNSAHESPIETVIAGWCLDRQYVDKHGEPKRLAITGPKASFSLLVKQYAGDVPHRAVLNELCRLGVTRQVGQCVEVRTLLALRQRQNFASLASLMPVLVDGIRLAANSRVRRDSSTMHRITLSAHNILDLQLIRKRCASSIQSMISGLSESLDTRLTVPRRTKQVPHSCSVTVLFVENKIPAVEIRGGPKEVSKNQA